MAEETENPATHKAIVKDADEYSPQLQLLLAKLYLENIDAQERLGNLDTCREFFNIWMGSNPDLPAWLSYVNFELKHGGLAQARGIFEVLVQCKPDVCSWIRYAEFEFDHGSQVGVRICCDRALSNLKDKKGLEWLILAFAKFEEQCQEIEKATRLYKLLFDECILSKYHAKILYKKVVDFEKRHENKKSIVKSVLEGRRAYFESVVKRDPMDFDVWWDYIQLEETVGDEGSIRMVYRRALENVPTIEDKFSWRQYVYLSILYALFEEIDAGDADRSRQAYKDCIRLIPHDKFSFSKIWLYAAKFEIKQSRVNNARKILDCAIRIAPKVKIFKEYIQMEVQMGGDVQQIRKIYAKYVQYSPEDCSEAWIECAEFEKSLDETQRARFIFELALSQPALQDSKLLWKAYTDFEISRGETSYPRELHNKILERKNHPNIWVSSARFEAYGVQEILKKHSMTDTSSIKSSCLKAARDVFAEALKQNGCFDYDTIPTNESVVENQIMLVKEWLEVERNFGEVGCCKLVHDKIPWRQKMRLDQHNHGVANRCMPALQALPHIQRSRSN